MEKTIGIFQAIYLSFYSKRLYRDVAQHWAGKSFLYLFILLSFICIYYAFASQSVTSLAYEAIYTSIAPQVPVIAIKDGKISTPEKKPYFITDPDSHENIAVIDTTGQYKTNAEAKAPVLLTETQLFMEKEKGEMRIYTVPANMETTVDPKEINVTIHQFLPYLWIPFFVIFLFLTFIYRILQALVYSIIGKIFANVYKVQLTYGKIMQIMLVAITPVMIISVIQHAIGLFIPFEFLFYFILAMAYLFFGILANKQENL